MAWPFSSVGAPNKDSGFVAVGAGAGTTNPPNFDSVSTYWLLGIYFSNPSDNDEFVTVTDGAGNSVVPQARVPARGVLPITDIEFMPIAGVLWQATDPALIGKVWGYS